MRLCPPGNRLHAAALAALAAAWAGAAPCAAADSFRSMAAAVTSPFSSDLTLPLERTRWDADRYPAENSLCGSDPRLPRTTPDGLLLPLSDAAGDRNGCGASGIRSKYYLGYGTYTAVLKAPIRSGETSAFFLINRWQQLHYLQKEIDFEFLGKDRHGVQVGILRYVHEQGGRTDAGTPHWIPLDFDVGEGFHAYSIRWSPTEVVWSVDGVDRYTRATDVPDEPMMIMALHWAPNPDLGWPVSWVGPLDRSAWPSATFFRSIAYAPH